MFDSTSTAIVSSAPGHTVPLPSPPESNATAFTSTSRLPSSGTKSGSRLSSRWRSSRTTSAGSPSHVEHAVVEHHRAVADVDDRVERVGDEHDRAAVALELAHPVDAPLLERLVAHGEHLVDQQDLGIDVHGDREPQPHEHARGVELHLVVHEVLELGERDDVVVDALGVPAREPQERRVQVDVLSSRELGVEPGAELQERRHAAAGADRALARPQDAGDALQQRRLAGAVVPDQADRRAFLDREGDVAQRPEVLGPRARDEQTLLHAARTLPIQPEALRDPFDLDRRRHSSSAKSPERRKNVRHASSRNPVDRASTIARRPACQATVTSGSTCMPP